MLNVKVDRKEILKAIQIVENSVTENKIREAFGFIGTPLRFIIRERSADDTTKIH